MSKLPIPIIYFIISWLSATTALAQNVIFSDDFEAGIVSDAWVAKPGIDNGVVNTYRLTAPDTNYVIRLGKLHDGNKQLVINRLDLPLDLSLHSRVLLQFDIAHYGEESHPQDGIYLSTDGGKFFTKIYGFSFDQWSARTMSTPSPLDVTLLARKKSLSLNNQTIIRFQQYGSHDFIGSAQYSDGIQLDNIQVLAFEDTYTTIPFKESFESKAWHPSLSVGNITEPNQPLSPFGVVESVYYDSLRGKILRMGSQRDEQLTTNALDLRVDLSSQKEVELLFKILNNGDETHPQDGIFFSPDGGQQFIKVFDFDLEAWREKEFGSYPPININRLAQQHKIPLTSQFVIRFQQHDDDDFAGSRLSSDGIYLDDIELRKATATYASYPLFEDFNHGSLASYWKVSVPDTRDTAVSVAPTGHVALVPHAKGYAIALGNTVDRLYNTNALDLHINLSQAENPELSFKIFNHYDETHSLDGVYFSNDAGQHFTKVIHFDGSSWATKAWGEFNALNLRAIAANHQLALTEHFVIRFQQHDDDDFEGTRTVSDGIYLDNISIQEPPHQYYAALPLIETFESDSLTKFWRAGNLSKTADEELIRPDASAQIIDGLGHSSPHALALGRAHNGELGVSAYDLHLDLSYQSNLELNFRMYSHKAESQKENGIWVSQNGGQSYQHAYSFRPSVPRQYVRYSINLDSLIETLALNYTDQFIIRFQHVGDRSFLGSDGFASGAILDDIVVTHRLTAPSVQDMRLRYQENSKQSQIQWPHSESAHNYQVQIFLEELSSQHLVADQTTKDNSLLLAKDVLLSGQLYYIRIRSINGISASDWSDPVAISANREGRISTSSLAIILP
ncbi:fibronectin type III domain-containing protein [Tunicatimonas pelagia]|uniref:fibronectin type III domain-containing protein n=1 Tax=Tunicatimonas pelagia TaxID=931531 RepID=UPI0026667E56|nr:fibronectin type III domain-containing protein [Tunicatimonas pelagia]WKN41584.1 fibronectin type III domain-containing protein [Tunicatimonas pelagia]